VIVSNTVNVKEIFKIYLIEEKIYPITKMSDTSITVIYHGMSLIVLYVSYDVRTVRIGKILKKTFYSSLHFKTFHIF
jgi:hypothetical protein